MDLVAIAQTGSDPFHFKSPTPFLALDICCQKRCYMSEETHWTWGSLPGGMYKIILQILAVCLNVTILTGCSAHLFRVSASVLEAGGRIRILVTLKCHLKQYDMLIMINLRLINFSGRYDQFGFLELGVLTGDRQCL